jgi:hypothetical protein
VGYGALGEFQLVRMVVAKLWQEVAKCCSYGLAKQERRIAEHAE